MQETFAVTVTAPDGTTEIIDAVAYTLDNPANYPDDAGDISEWDVSIQPLNHEADVLAFLAGQLDLDDMTLAEISAEVTGIATGAITYTPVSDDEAMLSPAGPEDPAS